MTGLEALNKIDNEVLYGVYAQEHYSNEIETIRKSLKALEIIKEKRVNIGVFYHVVFILKASYDGCKANNKTVLYNICDVKKDFLTKEEFNLLKEVLE